MRVAFVFLILYSKVFSETVTRFTNIKCEVLDLSYCTYQQCQLKVLGRGIIGLNLHATLLKGPLTNAKANLKLLRKYNGFRPFMFDTTIDVCKYLSTFQRELSFKQFMVDVVTEKSNINHSCPYEKELVVRDLILREDHFKFLPLPTGEYQIKVKAATNGNWKTIVSVNFMRTEDLLRT